MCKSLTTKVHKSTLNVSLSQTQTITRKLCYRKDDRAMRAILVNREALRDIAIRNYPRWRRHLEFIRIENSAIRSAVPENPTL